MSRALVSTRAVAGRRWQRRTDGHHAWCGQRCRAALAPLGEHLSDPITAHTGGVGHVVGTRVEAVNGRQRLELRIAVPVPLASEADQAAAVVRTLRAITDALLAAASI